MKTILIKLDACDADYFYQKIIPNKNVDIKKLKQILEKFIGYVEDAKYVFDSFTDEEFEILGLQCNEDIRELKTEKWIQSDVVYCLLGTEANKLISVEIID